MSNPPVIALPKTSSDRTLDLMTVFLLVVFWGISFYYYNDLPEEIPIHFDYAGEVDNYADKKTIFLLPLFGSMLAGFLTLVSRHPETFNYTVTITQENAERQYRNAMLMMRVMRIVIVFVFMLIDWEVIQIALGNSEGLGVWFLPILLIVVFVPIIYFAIRSKRLR
ncbi:MAG: DUF1648 domain-containing protein [Flavobacterium sp.]